MSEEHTKKLEAKCHCGSVHFTMEVAMAHLPLPVYLCHCSRCRFLSGAPFIFHFQAPEDSNIEYVAPSSEDKMTLYVYKGAKSGWKFCSNCGCHVVSQDLTTGRMYLSSSIFASHGPEDFQITEHRHRSSTKDGGLVGALTHIGDRLLGDWNPPKDHPEAKLVESQPEFDENGAQRLRAQCHCGGVSFTIPRPTPEIAQSELSYVRECVSAIDPSKWRGSIDLCDSCRLVSGTHLVSWTFVPLSVCDPPIKGDLVIGASKTYASSPDVLRSFCGTCGASVFYSCDDRRVDGKEVVDIATGILRAPEGVMALEWISWRTRLSFAEDGENFDEPFTKALVDGMKKWTLQHGPQEGDFSIC